MIKKSKQTTWILIAMILGIVTGWGINTYLPVAKASQISEHLGIVTDIFLRLIKMIIGPLVFTTLVAGIAHMGDSKTIGRIGFKAMGWFITASLISLLLGLVLANLLHPGEQLGLPLPTAASATHLKTSSLSLKEFITHLVPKSFIEAMANNEILEIVVFSLFFGIALAQLGDYGKQLLNVIDQAAQVMLNITNTVMKAAPIAVFASICAIISTHSLSILITFAKFMGSFYLSLMVLWIILLLAGLIFLGKSVFRLAALVKEAFLLAFSTASSEAAYPKLLKALDEFGVNRKISSFVLPLGYSFNLDGSMMYCTFAVLFIAQAYGIHLSVATQTSMLLIMMLTSKGMAGVPRASLVVIAAALNQFNIPEAGLMLILGVDQFLDMGRSATNTIGNSLASAVVAKWEGQLLPESNA